MDDWVFPGDALKYAIDSLCKLTQEEEQEIEAAHEYAVAIEHLALLRSRRWAQVLAAVGGSRVSCRRAGQRGPGVGEGL